MNITSTITKPAASLKASAAPQQKAENPTPNDSMTFSERDREKGSFGTMLRRGASWGAFMGVPAALGAVGAELGGKVGAEGGSLIGSLAAGGASQAYGMAHGGYAGWSITPGKKAGGIMLAMLTVPAGAAVGALAATGLSVAGSFGGWPVAAGLAGAGFAIGMVNGYMDPQPGNW
jgi:hypothetical protein